MEEIENKNKEPEVELNIAALDTHIAKLSKEIIQDVYLISKYDKTQAFSSLSLHIISLAMAATETKDSAKRCLDIINQLAIETIDELYDHLNESLKQERKS